METSYIQVSVKINPLGRTEQRSYEWIGKSPYVKVNRDCVAHLGQRGPAAQIGPYKLLKVEDGYFYGDFDLYVRADKLGALRVAFHKSTRLLDLMYRRLIITLAVWNLAEYHPAALPSWKDIKAVKRFVK